MMFTLVGTILFVAAGSLTIDRYQRVAGQDGDVGLALGSMGIITGLFMFIDTALLVKTYLGK